MQQPPRQHGDSATQDLKPWPRAAAIKDAIQKAEQIPEQIDDRYKNAPEKQVG